MSTDAGPRPASNVAAAQRFTRDRPCPICGGHGRLPRGQGRRCHGFPSSDGRYAHCSREERAGPPAAPPRPVAPREPDGTAQSAIRHP